MKILMKFNKITKISHKFSKLQKYSRIIINKNFQYTSIQRKFGKTTAIFILHPHIIDLSSVSRCSRVLWLMLKCFVAWCIFENCFNAKTARASFIFLSVSIILWLLVFVISRWKMNVMILIYIDSFRHLVYFIIAYLNWLIYNYFIKYLKIFKIYKI